VPTRAVENWQDERVRDRHGTTPGRASGLPGRLCTAVERAGYYPELVCDVLDIAVAGEEVRSQLVHLETTFDRDEIRRHVTVLVITPTRLVVAHADDHEPDALSPQPYAAANTETVPLHRVGSVVLSHAVINPERHRNGDTPRELTLTIGWGSINRVELEPAGCGDPECEADHGYSGTLTSDDITLRLSSDAEGAEKVREAVDFARALSAATVAAGASAARR
jgi:Family of unknown function (DUF5998)